MLKERGPKNWLKDFLHAMSNVDAGWTYWMRTGSKPKYDFLYVYLCIGGKVRYRANFVESHGAGYMSFDNGKTIHGNAWIVMCGPLVKGNHPMKGFQGFRYTETLF